MKLIAIFLFIFSFNIFACDTDGFVEDLTDEAAFAARQAVFDNMNLPGVRVGWNGMKELNKIYGLGGVNAVMCKYEKALKNRFESAAFKSQNPGVTVKVQKTDFKGYYISCTPKSSCQGVVETQLKNIPKPSFDDGRVFDNSFVRAQSYQEGYIRSRMITAYSPEQFANMELHEFIDKEMTEAIQEATGNPNLTKIDPNDKKFLDELAKNVDEFRNNGMDNVDPKFRRLVQGLDTLLEIPYSSSSNIENDLLKGLKEGDLVPGTNYKISVAQSGDDLFVIIKEGDQVVKIMGADAKGLGVENMTSRYLEFLGQKSGASIESMSDVSSLSLRAIDRADLRMENSFVKYKNILQVELANPLNRNLDEALIAAHHRYDLDLKQTQFENMVIRAGAIDISNCTNDVKCFMNRITTIHNNLKTMEAAGISNHFGTSCLSTEYWILKMGLKAISK